jgi:hypothetical protein
MAVDLSVVPPLPGTSQMVVKKEHCNGGTYASLINVQARFTFTKLFGPGVPPGSVRVLDTGLEGIPPIQLQQIGMCGTMGLPCLSDADCPPPEKCLGLPPWSHQLDPYLNLASAGKDCTGWHPGIEDPNPQTACDCNTNGIHDSCDVGTNGGSDDCNANGIPDECDPDADGDGIPDDCDNCPDADNPLQGDMDGDGLGDVCEGLSCQPTADGTACEAAVCPVSTNGCLPRCVSFDPSTGVTTVTTCGCRDPNECQVDLVSGARGARGGGVGGAPCVIPDVGTSGTIRLPPDGCDYLSPDEVHEILDGLPAGTHVELAAIHKDFICDQTDPAGLCTRPPPPGLCEDLSSSGGSLGGNVDCFESTLELHISGIMTNGARGGLPTVVLLPTSCEVHTGPRNPGDAIQQFPTDMFRMFGSLGGPDPNFDLLQITAGTDFGLPSPGHTTLTRLGPPGSAFAVDSHFDITYRIDYQGAATGGLGGMSGSTTGTIRMSTGTSPPGCIGGCPPGTVCLETTTVDPNGLINICCDCITPPRFEFSLDIGSDTELSDPFVDGDEGFDPGDVYRWQGPPVTPPAVPCGRDGFKDDLFIFGADPFPDPPDCGTPPLTAVPVGNGCAPPLCYPNWFDLDAHDQVDFSSLQTDFGLPIPRFPSNCVHDPQFLMISYDDDMASGWPLFGPGPPFDVPVGAPSPAGVSSYGTAVARDEVIGVILGPGLPPFPVVLVYPIASETGVHLSLTPNPPGETCDDDVDSLDAVLDQQSCPVWLFSADHEAHLGLDPGSIYELVAGGPPVLIIDDVAQLGLLESTDVDAFEFTWLPDAAGAMFLAILFSVDDDDPLTAPDESGGLDPKMIYGSFFGGVNFPVLTGPLDDDIDALAIWVEEIPPQPAISGARSCRNHGVVEHCLDLLVSNIEPRLGGVQKMEFDLTDPVSSVSASVSCVNNNYLGVVTVVTPPPAGTLVTLTFVPALPDKDCCKIELSGEVNDTFYVRTLVGDVNRDGGVSSADAASVKARLGQLISSATFQYDVNTDGSISSADFASVKARLGSVAPPCPGCP